MLHLVLEPGCDLVVAARAEVDGYKLRGALAYPLGQILAGDDEVLAAVVAPAQDDMRMRVAVMPISA
jgi:hypothetical protein